MSEDLLERYKLLQKIDTFAWWESDVHKKINECNGFKIFKIAVNKIQFT
jgi:hypothetical protein